MERRKGKRRSRHGTIGSSMAATRRVPGGDVSPTVWRALVWSYRKGEGKPVLLRKSTPLSLLMLISCSSVKDLLRKEVARGRDRGALVRRLGGGRDVREQQCSGGEGKNASSQVESGQW